MARWQYYTSVEAHLEPVFNGYELNDVPASSAFKISAGRHARSGKIANSLGNENQYSNVLVLYLERPPAQLCAAAWIQRGASDTAT